ncbi:hypothetical protein Taro_017927 [Colocasia esculenta]|uniref:MOM1 alpha-helical domain-containing protein n=1 Tax=Colocasia esculenta TaxID=4460 RepID=A0A843UPF3_COLES|nr:hypothetical protein [Colocasia esculenta]
MHLCEGHLFEDWAVSSAVFAPATAPVVQVASDMNSQGRQCWRAASIVKPKLDHRISLLLAKKHLNYECTEQEAESVYSKLRMLKKRFEKYVVLKSHSQLNNSSSRKEIEGEPLHEKEPVPAVSVRQELVGEIKWSQGNDRFPERQSLPGQDQTHVLEVPLAKHHLDIGQLKGEFQSKCIGLIEKISLKRKEKLLQKQQLEEKEFRKYREHEKAKVQKAYEELVDFISAAGLSCEVAKEKINLLKEEFSNGMEKFEEHMKGQRRKLAVLQVEARNKEEQILKCWLAEANAGTLTESFDEIPLADTGFTPDEFRDAEQLRAYDSLRNTLSLGREHESSCSVVEGQTVSIHQDNVPANVLPPTSVGTADDLPGAGMVALPEVQGVENYTEPECAPMSTSSEVQGSSPLAHALSSFDISLPSHQEIGMVILSDTQAEENNAEPECTRMSTSSEIQESSPASQALSNCNVDCSFQSHQVPSNPHERPPLLDGFDSGQCLNSSQAVIDGTSQSSDSPAKLHPTSSYSVPAQLHPTSQSPNCVPVRLLPPDDVMVHNSVSILPEVHGATESLHELISSRPDTIPSTQSENDHGTDENHSTNPVQLSTQDSSGTGVNLQTTSLDGLETGKQMTSLDENTLISSDESSRLVTLQTEPSDQPLEQTAALDGLNVGEMNSSQNPSQEIIDSSLQVQATADLSSRQCDIAHVGTPGGLRDEVTGNTFCPPNQVQSSAQQSSGLVASQAGHSDIAGTIGQESNSSHHTSLQIPATAELTYNFSHDNPFAHQVQLLPVDSLGTTSSQAGQTIVGMQPFASISLGIMDNPTSAIEESNSHLLQPHSVVPQASLHDPLQNELNKIRKEEDRDAEMCEKEKQRLKLELEKELEQIRKKYDSLINDVETQLAERKRTFTILYNKVSLSRILSEEFQSRFFERNTSKGASSQGTGASSAMQMLHASQPQISAHREALASTSAATPLVSLGHVRASAAVPRIEQVATSIARARVAGPAISPTSPSSGPPVQVVHHSSALFSSNPAVRHISPVLTPRLNYQAGSSRAPAPHLHPFRANAPMPISNSPLRPRGSLNQQQLPSHTMSSMPPQLVSTPLSFQRMDPVSGTRRQENLSMRPVLAASQSIPSFAADVRNEATARSVANVSPSLDVEQRRSSAHASSASGQPTPGSEAAAAPADVICLADD